MGQAATSRDYYHAYNDEPHATRRKEMLSKWNRSMFNNGAIDPIFREIPWDQAIDGSWLANGDPSDNLCGDSDCLGHSHATLLMVDNPRHCLRDRWNNQP